MNRIVHIALKVDNLERTTQFYEKVFGFKESKTQKVRDHTRAISPTARSTCRSCSTTPTPNPPSRRPGRRPCIHHFAVEVDDLKEAEKEVRAFGCKIISDPGVIPVKFRAPGGTVCEIVPRAATGSPPKNSRSRLGGEHGGRNPQVGRPVVGRCARGARPLHHHSGRAVGVSRP